MSAVLSHVAAGLPGVLTSTRLANGLEVHLLDNPDAPVVTTALSYRAGGRDDPPGRAGLAHFLEHMMFKGSNGFAAGQIDRITRVLGGSNNAFTSQDLTTYHFSFGRRSWYRALDIEADRMHGLALADDEVERERAVILEEIAMYDAEPWEALDRAVRTAFYGEHPYARPVVGTATEVGAVGRDELASFHRRFYRPDNAVLVLAGGLGEEALTEVEARFGGFVAGRENRPSCPAPPRLDTAERLRLERGRVARLLLWLPVPAADHPDFPALRLLAALLGLGRSSRLQDALVERSGECAWLSLSLGETALGGALQVAAELVPGGEPDRVEETLLTEIGRLRRGGVEEPSLRRALRLLEADWVFAHERIEEQAMTLSQVATLFSPGYASAQLQALRRLGVEDLAQVAERYLDLERGSVLGWAVPAS